MIDVVRYSTRYSSELSNGVDYISLLLGSFSVTVIVKLCCQDISVSHLLFNKLRPHIVIKKDE